MIAFIRRWIERLKHPLLVVDGPRTFAMGLRKEFADAYRRWPRCEQDRNRKNCAQRARSVCCRGQIGHEWLRLPKEAGVAREIECARCGAHHGGLFIALDFRVAQRKFGAYVNDEPIVRVWDHRAEMDARIGRAVDAGDLAMLSERHRVTDPTADELERAKQKFRAFQSAPFTVEDTPENRANAENIRATLLEQTGIDVAKGLDEPCTLCGRFGLHVCADSGAPRFGVTGGNIITDSKGNPPCPRCHAFGDWDHTKERCDENVARVRRLAARLAPETRSKTAIGHYAAGLAASARANIMLARTGQTPYHGGKPTPELLRAIRERLERSVPRIHWWSRNEIEVRKALGLEDADEPTSTQTMRSVRIANPYVNGPRESRHWNLAQPVRIDAEGNLIITRPGAPEGFGPIWTITVMRDDGTFDISRGADQPPGV